MPVANMNSQYQLDWDIAQQSQSVAANTSVVYGRLILRKLHGDGWRSSTARNWSVTINGQTFAGTYTYDFSRYSELLLWQGTVTVAHNADGTKQITSSGWANMDPPSGQATINQPLTLSTIARASTATFAGGAAFDAGTAVTINTNRASTSFTHDITWEFGSQSGTVATGVGASVGWTPPLSMLAAIPDMTQATGTISVVTKNGSTVIGTTSTRFTARAPASVVPTVSAVNGQDDNPIVKSVVGQYVQGMSLLRATVTAAGAYGSTITATEVAVDGITVPVGTAIPLDVAGTRTVTARVTDSRGRQGTRNVTVNVLPYNPPQRTWTVKRALANGTPDDNGTYLRIDLTAEARSLVNGTERNALKINVATRAAGTTAWTARNSIAAGLKYASNFLISGGGIFPITQSFDVRLTIADNLIPVAMEETETVTTAQIALDFDGRNGIGVGRYRQRGTLDVEGDTYTSGQMQADGEVVTRGRAAVAPIGGVYLWLTNTPPAGALIADGSAVSRTTYAGLFGVIGTTYGAGNGSTTFNLPNFRGLVPVGVDTAQPEFNALGKKGGAKTHTLTVAEIPSHTHSTKINTGLVNARTNGTAQYNADSGGSEPTGATGGGGAHNNLQPYIAVHYVIQAL